MSLLSDVGLALLFVAAGCQVAAVRLRAEPAAGWRDWWTGAWAPLDEFGAKGWHWAVGARVLTGLGLLLYVLGRHGSVASR
jgi:hypothetical protein